MQRNLNHKSDVDGNKPKHFKTRTDRVFDLNGTEIQTRDRIQIYINKTYKTNNNKHRQRKL